MRGVEQIEKFVVDSRVGEAVRVGAALDALPYLVVPVLIQDFPVCGSAAE